MNKSIAAQDNHKLFAEYPIRPDPYPQPLKIDFKTKRPIDPATKKPTDPANLLPKKKKVTKKNPGYVIPVWATELKVLNDKIIEQEGLLLIKDQLGLSE